MADVLKKQRGQTLVIHEHHNARGRGPGFAAAS